MERLCRADVAFRVICAGNLPYHVTFARFRADFPAAVGDFFAEVLKLCARLGMGKLGTVALDGMKIAASASKAANRTEDTLVKLAEEAVAAHAAADAAEDELFGAGRRGWRWPRRTWPGSGPRGPPGLPGWRSGMRPGSPAAAGRPESMTTAGSRKPEPSWRRPGRGPPRRTARPPGGRRTGRAPARS